MSEDIKNLVQVYEDCKSKELVSFDLSGLIDQISDGRSLSCEQSITAMRILMSGKASEEQMRELLIALHNKGETTEEIASFAFTMREFADSVEEARTNRSKGFADTCGTGGKAAEGITIDTFNVSTATAFVLAACGIKVAKHGNRSITSSSGSCDVLEALGVNIDLSLEDIYKCILKTGIGFIFAPKVHSATRFVQPIRKTISHPTIFNILGPLSNPFYTDFQLMGVYDADLTEKAAEALSLLGLKKALVVHGFNGDKTAGMDECSLCGPTRISELKSGGEVDTYNVTPKELGFDEIEPSQLNGGTPSESAELIKDIFAGKDKGPKKDLIVLNSAAALVACKKVADLKEGVICAEEVIDSGNVIDKIKELVDFTNEAAS